MNPVRCPSFSSQNSDLCSGGDSPPESEPSHPLGFLLLRAPNPNTASPVLHSFFPLSPNDMELMTPTSPTPDKATSPHLRRSLQSQEASPASPSADSPPVLRRQHVTTDSESRRQGLEALERLIDKSKRAEAARNVHPGLQICNPPAQIARKTPKSDSRNIRKSVPFMVGKAASSKTTASDLFSVAKALGGETLLDLVCEAYASYVLKDTTEGRRELFDQSEVDQN